MNYHELMKIQKLTYLKTITMAKEMTLYSTMQKLRPQTFFINRIFSQGKSLYGGEDGWVQFYKREQPEMTETVVFTKRANIRIQPGKE